MPISEKGREKISKMMKENNPMKRQEIKAKNPALFKHGQTWEERFGKEKAQEMKARLAKRAKKMMLEKNPMKNPLIIKACYRTNAVRSPNLEERQLKEILDRNFPNEWIFIGNRKIRIGKHLPDFLSMSKKKVIEYLGYWWHRESDIQEIKNSYKEFGFDCLIIKPSDLENESELVRKISNWF